MNSSPLTAPTVARLTADFMKAVGYRGILDIGYRYDARDGLYKLLDPNPRIGQTFRLFVDGHGMDVARYAYLDLTGQPLPAAEPVEGRRWLVEDNDFESCIAYRREGALSLGQWLASYRGVDEGAWFAWDDPVPFARMMWSLAAKAAAYATRPLRTRSVSASSPAGRPAA